LALVPKDLDEEGFWCNYFFRVNTIKKAYGLSEVPQLKEGVSAPAPSVLRSSLSSSGSSVGKRDVDPAEVDFTYIAPTAPGEPNLVGLMALDEAESDSLSDSDDSLSLPFESLQPTETPLSPSPAPFIDLETAGTRYLTTVSKAQERDFVPSTKSSDLLALPEFFSDPKLTIRCDSSLPMLHLTRLVTNFVTEGAWTMNID
jgi:hypothetical protein